MFLTLYTPHSEVAMFRECPKDYPEIAEELENENANFFEKISNYSFEENTPTAVRLFFSLLVGILLGSFFTLIFLALVWFGGIFF